MSDPNPPCSLCGSRGQVSKFLRLLPTEIITIIFSLCIPEFNPRMYRTKYDAAEVLRLASICRSLRAFVHSTPALWATAMFFQEPGQDYQYISQWLSRAKSLPLSIRVDYVGATPCEPKLHNWGDVDDAFLLEVAPLSSKHLAPFLPQCRELDIKIFKVSEKTLPTTPGALQNLESFSLWVGDMFAWSVVLNSDIAPKLTSVTTEGATLEYELPTVLPWENLVHVEMSRIYPHNVIEILRDTPTIETLAAWTVDHDYNPGDSHRTTALITVPNLRVLDWRGVIPPEIALMLDDITAPSLTHLCLLAMNEYAMSPACLSRFIRTLTLFITTLCWDYDDYFDIWAVSDCTTVIHTESYGPLDYFRDCLPPAAYVASLIKHPDDEDWDDITYYLPPISHT